MPLLTKSDRHGGHADPAKQTGSPENLCRWIDDTIGPRRLYPISFSIPDAFVVDRVPPKSKDLAGGQSRGRRVYQFSLEQEAQYHADYQTSRFGLTYRKGGFDCMRHLEILANGCLPYFPGHQDIPRLTMVHYPKTGIAQATVLGEGLAVDGYELIKSQPDQPLNHDPAAYQTLAQALIDHTREHLTTTAMARYLLRQMGQPNAKSVLFVGDGHKADHCSNLLFHGLRTLLGPHCVDAPKLPWMYRDFPVEKCDRLHGRGFTYARKLPVVDVHRAQLKKRIAQQAFDLIVFGAVHRQLDLLHTVRRHYDPQQIALIDGEDHPWPIGSYKRCQPKYSLTAHPRIPAKQIAAQGVYFKREMDDAFVIEFAARRAGKQ